MRSNLSRRAVFLVLLIVCFLVLSCPSPASMEDAEAIQFPTDLLAQFSVRQVGATTVYYRRIPGEDMVGIAAMMRAGTGDQEADEAHCAHMAEHMVFHYPLRSGSTLAHLINGGNPSSPAYYNGFTGLDSTQYWLAVPSGSDPSILTSFLNSLFSHPLAKDSSWDKEMKRSSSEIKYMTTNELSATLNRLKVNLLKGTPYEEALFETPLGDVTPEKVSSFMEREYSPARLTLVIAGDWDEDSVVDAIERGLYGIPTGKDPAVRDIEISPDEYSVLQLPEVATSRITIGVGVDSVAPEDTFALLTLWSAVASRLQRLTLEGLRIQSDVSSFPMVTASAAAFSFTCLEAHTEKSADRLRANALDAVQSVLMDFASGNVTHEDLRMTYEEIDPKKREAMEQMSARIPKPLVEASAVLNTLMPEIGTGHSFTDEDALVAGLRAAAAKYLPGSKTTVLLTVRRPSVSLGVAIAVATVALSGAGLFFIRLRKGRPRLRRA